MDSGLWSLDATRRIAITSHRPIVSAKNWDQPSTQVTERNLAAKIIRTRGAFRRFTTGHNEVCGNWHWKA
ncbi:hypothetical protein PAHAL_3G175700 [Panicum hallii]|uniref:Uncharacterized protein n=1 Tax=Panicum hallii TaxID=206008 RepID=A0A2S3H9K8_9POAL|nr:hypothetical protein PAHAL_3G175700 [Panicum hallii]